MLLWLLGRVYYELCLDVVTTRRIVSACVGRDLSLARPVSPKASGHSPEASAGTHRGVAYRMYDVQAGRRYTMT